MNYDDETLMAYTDGELDESLSAQITAAVQRDPELAKRVQRQRALRARVAGAFAPVLDQPVPDRLLAAAKGPATLPADHDPPRGEVLTFPARSAPAARRWGTREWMAMAASLLLGMLLSWQFLPSSQRPMIAASGGTLVARGALAGALDSQLASTQRPEEPVQIGLSFRSQDGSYCRSFALRRAQTAGLACRAGDEWRIAVTESAPHSGADMRQAASLPPAVLAAIEAKIAGEALDAAGEENARLSGWDSRHSE